jgi:hypothetical protein
MRLRGIFLGVAAALVGAAVAHDAYAGKSGGGRSSASAGGTRSAPAMSSMRSSFAGTVRAQARTVVGTPQHFHNGSFPHRHFHSSFVAIGVGVPIYAYPGSYYYPGYYYPDYYSPPPPPPGWYFCPAYNAYYPASVPCPSYGPPQGYAPPPQMYGAPPDTYGVPPDYVPPQ